MIKTDCSEICVVYLSFYRYYKYLLMCLLSEKSEEYIPLKYCWKAHSKMRVDDTRQKKRAYCCFSTRLPNWRNFEQNGDRREKSLSDSFVVAKCRSKADPEGGETETDSKLCGWLVKYSSIGFVKTSKLHWFIFGDDTCKLYYYRQPQDLLPLGEIDIKHATLFFDASNREKPGSFEIRYCI